MPFIKIISNIILLFILFLLCGNITSKAEELSPVFTLSTGGDGAYMKDKSHSTFYTFNRGASIIVQSTENTPFTGIYIIWDSPVVEWTLHTEQGDITCGQNGFLHEYISLDSPVTNVIVQIPEDNMRISDIRIFEEGPLPEDVQLWNPPCEKADILLVPSHADDEILFLGGIIPTYGVVREAQIQVAYMSEFWSSSKIREHEKLDGLWEAGLKNYPVCGNFKDVYSETIETAQEQYDFNDMVNYITEQIRRFQPQVIVTHDQNGEYGHGFHMLTSKAVTTAVEAASDENQFTESASLYGIWDTPKTYLHLYENNKIHLNLRQPIASMGGRTALEIASDAYKKHVSQQWCWFYVSDDYEYSCADFGLYRTTIGEDKSRNDLMEHLKTYQEQQREEEERIAAEEKRLLELEQERLAQEKLEQQKLEQEQLEQQKLEEQKQEQLRQEEQLKQQQEKRLYSFILILLLSAGILLTILILIGTGMILKRRRR